MKCTVCNKNEATVFYREMINGKERKYALCHNCASKKENEFGAYTADLFKKGLFDNFFAAPTVAAKKQEEKRCNLCASTFKDLQRSGRVGCPVCYTTFERELSNTVTRLHGDSVHKGITPQRYVKEETIDDKISALEKDLRVAISEEEYEKAAMIRDKLREMKGKE